MVRIEAGFGLYATRVDTARNKIRETGSAGDEDYLFMDYRDKKAQAIAESRLTPVLKRVLATHLREFYGSGDWKDLYKDWEAAAAIRER